MVVLYLCVHSDKAAMYHMFCFQQFYWTSCCPVDNWYGGKCSSKDSDPHLDPGVWRSRNHHWAVGVGETSHQNPGRGSCQNYPLKVKWPTRQPSIKMIDILKISVKEWIKKRKQKMKVVINTERNIWMIKVNIVNNMIPHCLKFIHFLMCMTDITVSVNVIWLHSCWLQWIIVIQFVMYSWGFYLAI